MTHYNPFGIHYFPQRIEDEGVQKGEFRYSSSIDDINNLYAHYTYNSGKTDLPIVILMHGYTQDANSMTDFIMQDMADFGFFACAVGMRGRNGASGLVDVNGRELYDIIDAIEYVKNNFGQHVDMTNINVVGYSGGGGNVFALASKFPDYFNTLVSHFGISDYGYDPVNSWWATNSTRRTSMTNWIGFTPEINIGAYHSRASNLGIGRNYKGGHLFIFHDEGDGNVPPIQSRIVQREMDINGLTNYTLDITDGTDAIRWKHASPHVTEDVRQSREIWGYPILNKTYKQWSVSDSGDVLVQGYLKTKKFEIWLGNGQEHVADVSYDTSTNTYTVTPLTGSVDVTITQDGQTATQLVSEETTITL